MNFALLDLQARVNRLEAIIRSKLEPSLPEDPPPKPHDAVLDAVASVWDIKTEVLLSTCRTANVSDARRATVMLLMKYTGMDQTQVGSFLNRVPSAISKAKTDATAYLENDPFFKTKYSQAEELIKAKVKL